MTIKKKLVFSALGVSLLATGGALLEDNGLFTTNAQKVLASEVGQQQVENGQMLEYVNNRRAEENAKISNGGTSDVNGTRYAQKLEHSQDLENFANWKARDMAENQYFDHTSPDGAEVVEQYHNMFGNDTKLRYSGENIYVSNINLTKEEFERWAFDAWHESKPHDTGMVREYNTHLGFGYYLDEETGYTYGVHHFGHDPEAYQRNDSANGGVDPSEDMKQWYSSKQVKEGLEHSYRPGSDGNYHGFGDGGDPAQYKAVDQEQYRNGSYLKNEVETPEVEEDKDIWDNTGESKEPEEEDYEGGVVGEGEDETVEIPPTVPSEPEEPVEDVVEEPTTPVEPVEPTEPETPVEDEVEEPTTPSEPSEPETPVEDEVEEPTTPVEDVEEPTTPSEPVEEESKDESNSETETDKEVELEEPVKDEEKEDATEDVEVEVDSETNEENTDSENSGEDITSEGKEGVEGTIEESDTVGSENSETVDNNSDDLELETADEVKETGKEESNLVADTVETTEEKDEVVVGVGKEINENTIEVKKDVKEVGTKTVNEDEDTELLISEDKADELPKTGVVNEEGMKGSLLGLVLTTIGLGFLVRKYRREGQEEL